MLKQDLIERRLLLVKQITEGSKNQLEEPNEHFRCSIFINWHFKLEYRLLDHLEYVYRRR